jgi:hypothetical protein
MNIGVTTMLLRVVETSIGFRMDRVYNIKPGVAAGVSVPGT